MSRSTWAELDPHLVFTGGGIVWQLGPLAGEVEPESLVHLPGGVVAVGDPQPDGGRALAGGRSGTPMPTDLTITVSVEDDLVIDITDNGDGIPDTVARSGLHNLTQRATTSGGSCSITRPAQGGTRLVWTAPLP